MIKIIIIQCYISTPKCFQICPYCDINHKVSLFSRNMFSSFCLTDFIGKVSVIYGVNSQTILRWGNKLMKRESTSPHKQRKEVPLVLSLGFSRGSRCRYCKFLFSHRGRMESQRHWMRGGDTNNCSSKIIYSETHRSKGLLLIII